MNATFRRFVLSYSLGLLPVGCGSDKLPTYPASGQVTFRDGRILPGGVVEFRSRRPEAKGLNARGSIGKDGSFVLGTYGASDGAVEGEHEAIVVPLLPTDPRFDEGGPLRPAVQSRFRDYNTSGLRFTVKKGEANIFELKVE